MNGQPRADRCGHWLFDGEYLLRAGVASAFNNGALFLASSGNSGPTENSIGYPAAYDEVVAVGILGADRIVSRMSSRGADDGNDAVISDEEVELIGGGFVVESTWLDGCYQVLSGTSMSTPSIAGFAAANWQGDAASTRSWLVSVADDIDNSALVPSFDPSTPGWDRVSGHGMSRTAAGTDGSGGAGVVVSPNIVAPDESVSIDVLGPPDSAYRVGINSPDGSWTFGEFTTDAAGVSLLGLTPWTDVGAWLITVDFGGGTTTFLPAFDTFEQASSVDPPPPDPGLITSFELENPGEVPDPAIATISGNVTVEAGSGYTGPQLLGGIPAPDGSQFAYLTNGPGSNGGGDSGSDRTGALGNEFDVAELTVSFTADDPTNVEFQYDVLSSEITDGESPTPDPAPDPFEIRLDGVTIASGAVGQANGSFPAVNGFNLTNITGSDGSFFSDGRLGFATLSTPVAAGPHTLEFFVGDDDGDPAVDTAMLVDEIRLVPEPSTTALLVAGMIFLISASGRRNP